MFVCKKCIKKFPYANSFTHQDYYLTASTVPCKICKQKLPWMHFLHVFIHDDHKESK